MPTYEYRCRDCGHQFEIVQAFTDDSLTECPECHGSLGKVFGNIGISFKGSGFYKNDSRADTSKTSDSSSGDNGSSSSESTSSETASSEASSSSTSGASSADSSKASGSADT